MNLALNAVIIAIPLIIYPLTAPDTKPKTDAVKLNIQISATTEKALRSTDEMIGLVEELYLHLINN